MKPFEHWLSCELLVCRVASAVHLVGHLRSAWCWKVPLKLYIKNCIGLKTYEIKKNSHEELRIPLLLPLFFV